MLLHAVLKFRLQEIKINKEVCFKYKKFYVAVVRHGGLDCVYPVNSQPKGCDYI
jgi:hypothetical protein